jgi:hypothetical protein
MSCAATRIQQGAEKGAICTKLPSGRLDKRFADVYQ